MTTTTAPEAPAADTAGAPAPAAPIVNDGGKPPYKDPTGDTAATNVDRERTAEQADEDSKAGKEAAKYRRQLRETETERDSLRTQLAAFQTQAVDNLAEAGGIRAAALWAAGTELSTLLEDDGTVSADAVTAAIAAATEALGLKPVASARDAGLTAVSDVADSHQMSWAGITKA